MSVSRIEFRSVCKRYPGASTLTIKDANVTVAPGEFCVFVGPSGCGKSTALRMIAGLEDITSGDLRIDGEVVNNTPPSTRGVAMVFQSYALYPHMTVYENMAFGLRVFGSNKSEIDHKVRKAAQTLQLTPLLERLPKALSGGQRQRVAIGRAIVKEPKVFLFDEPLSNLDAALRVQTRLEIAKLHREMGSASMVYVTHDQVEAMTLADKIVLLNTGDAIEREGSVAQVGSPMTLYHRPNSLFVAQFIGSPKMNVLPATFDGLAGDHARVKVANTPLNAAVDTQGLAAASAVSIGVRPEHIALRPAGDLGSDGLLGAVQHTERLGEATLVYFDVGHGLPLVNVRLPGDAQINRGEQYALVVAPDAMHVFNSAGRAQPRKVELNN